jgi:GAF domain-containing protein
MTRFDPASGLRRTPDDTELTQRIERLGELGLDAPDAKLDHFATDLAREADAPYAMINFITHEQFFAGLHNPDGALPTTTALGPQPAPVGRTMARDHGFCPEVLNLRKARVLTDTWSHPRWKSNRVVDQIGIRTYAGAPLIDDETGIALGTVCYVGTEPRSLETGRPAVDLIKNHRDRVMQYIYRRAGIQ